MHHISDVEKNKETLIHGIPLDSYASQKILSHVSPFVPVPWHIRILISLATTIIHLFEKFIGTRIFIENKLRELFLIDSRLRSLILRLASKKIIISWDRMPGKPDAPLFIQYRIQLAPIILPNGEAVNIQGSQGSGVAHTENEALLITLAEALERYSCATWNTEDIVIGNYNNLAKKGAVPTNQFLSFFKKQSEKKFQKEKLTDSKEIGWVKATRFPKRESCLIPASLVYLFYNRAEPHYDDFLEISTSGVGAHSSYEKAAYSALCEIIERDSLMIFWLNKLTPPRINLNTISIPLVKEKIKILHSYGFELHILDITTDIAVPAFCAVLIDRKGGRAVSLSAAAGYNIPHTFDRLILEVMKFTTAKTAANHPEKEFSNINSFKKRAVFWSDKKMIEKIDFFVSGEENDFASTMRKSIKAKATSMLSDIGKIFDQKGYHCYLADITPKAALKEGLYVVRAVSPDLIPVYFNEDEKPVGFPRLYAAPVQMGYKKSPLSENELNLTPHPFL